MLSNRLAYRHIISRISAALPESGRALRKKKAAGVVEETFIFTTAPFAFAHASTIAETPQGLVAAWFGGTFEGHSDVGIWLSRHEGEAWSPPVEVANGVTDGERYPCWNPVLFQPIQGPLMLFYKVGPSPKGWWGMVMRSTDGGKTWSAPQRLPQGIFGPIKNKPIQLTNGDILSPSSEEVGGWRVHLERSTDGGETWQRIGPINDGRTLVAIQPSVLHYPDGRLQLLCRSKQRWVTESWSDDNGLSWSTMSATGLPNPNSGTDAVSLTDARQLLVYNHSARARSPLNVAVSTDGRHWQAALVLEDRIGEYSYPAVIQSSDGLVHITYTWNLCRIKHVVIDPAELSLAPNASGG